MITTMKENKKTQTKFIVISALVGFFLFPTIVLGGGFITSLIQVKTTEEAIHILANQLDSIMGRVTTLENNQDIEKACRIASELSVAPPETKIASYTETSHQPQNASWAPDSTEGLLEYLEAYMENYNSTGSRLYLHNPDYDSAFVAGYISVLKERLQQYNVQKDICGIK